MISNPFPKIVNLDLIFTRYGHLSVDLGTIHTDTKSTFHHKIQSSPSTDVQYATAMYSISTSNLDHISRYIIVLIRPTFIESLPDAKCEIRTFIIEHSIRQSNPHSPVSRHHNYSRTNRLSINT